MFIRFQYLTVTLLSCPPSLLLPLAIPCTISYR